MEGDLQGLLHRALTTTCPACGAEQAPRAVACSACGASLVDEGDEFESFSYTEAHPGGGAAGPEGDVPLEKTRNFRALQKAARILEGGCEEDEYQGIMARLKAVATNGVQLFAHSLAQQKLATLDAEGQAASEKMRRGFEQLDRGVRRMDAFLTSRNAEDLRAGYADAEAGFRAIDEARRRAQELKDAQEERTDS